MVKFVKNKEGVELKRGNIPQCNTHIPQQSTTFWETPK